MAESAADVSGALVPRTAELSADIYDLIVREISHQYRVRRAKEGLGRPIDESRLHVELALLASQWLGATVLPHVGKPRP